MGLTLTVPKLTLIVERTVFDTAEAWLKTTRSFLPLLDQYSNFAIQLRSVSQQADDDRAWINEQLPYHPMIRMNGSMHTDKFCHLPQRMVQSLNRPFSTSVHCQKSIKAAAAYGASYVHLGPLYPPKSKSKLALGESEFHKLVVYSQLPVVAVGGIDHTNIHRPFELGAAGVSLIGSVLQHPTPLDYCTRLLKEVLKL